MSWGRQPSELARCEGMNRIAAAQRILIAMAVLHRPALLIADEPTSALDGNTQRGIIELLARLKREFAMAILYISRPGFGSGAL